MLSEKDVELLIRDKALRTTYQYESAQSPHPLKLCRIEVKRGEPSYSDIFKNCIWMNEPCLLTGDVCCDSKGEPWPAMVYWKKLDDKSGSCVINKDYLIENYGDDVVPVAQCSKQMYNDHPKMEMTLREYLTQFYTMKESLYVKDYHFNRQHPDCQVYTCPDYFTSDWLNEYCNDHGLDDYRFVYMGPKGTWTPFHADVLRSFSWSANVVGKKLWILYPPGSEDLLRDKNGKLPYDVNRSPYTNTDHPSNRYREEVIQHENEIIFIPSGWHHQVHNLEETLSINHNWFNGCNIQQCWSHLQLCLSEVQKEISDCISMENWQGHCQVLLKAYQGFNYRDIIGIVHHILLKRLAEFGYRDHKYHVIFDVKSIERLLEVTVEDRNLSSADKNTVSFLLSQIHTTLSVLQYV